MPYRDNFTYIVSQVSSTNSFWPIICKISCGFEIYYRRMIKKKLDETDKVYRETQK